MGDCFAYVHCDDCGSIWIRDVPDNLSEYYPPDYYSHHRDNDWRSRVQPAAMRFAVRFTVPRLPRIHFPHARVAQSIGISRSTSVLDVGSGLSGLAVQLASIGHPSAIGVDPFIGEDTPVVRKCELSEIGGSWDYIVFSHSLEHIEDPLRTLQSSAQLLSPRGNIIVRVPVVSWAFSEYGEYWFQLDAPRHLFIPSENGMAALASRAGLRIRKMEYDSTFAQFWISELYRDGITQREVAGNEWSYLTRSRRRKLTRRAELLNAQHRGDQAQFWLSP